MARCALNLLLVLFLAPLLGTQGDTGGSPPSWQSCEGRHPRFSDQPALINGIWHAFSWDGTEESWEFWGQSFFRYTRISRRTWLAERGRFHLVGRHLTLHVTSESSARLGDAANTGTRCLDQTRRLTLIILGPAGANGLVINGLYLRRMSP